MLEFRLVNASMAELTKQQGEDEDEDNAQKDTEGDLQSLEQLFQVCSHDLTSLSLFVQKLCKPVLHICSCCLVQGLRHGEEGGF